MTDNKKTIKILTVVFAVEAIILGVFRGIISAKFIDISNGLYKNAAMGNIFLALLAIVIAVTVASYLILKRKQYAEGLVLSAKSVKAASLICAAALAALIVSGLVNIVSAGILAAVELVICVFALIYFAASAFGKSASGKGMLPLLTALWLGFRTIRIFIDTSEQINASGRSFTLLFLVCAMLFFLAEAEFFIPLTDEEKKTEAHNRRCAKLITTGFAVFQLAVIFAGSEIVVIALGTYPAEKLIPCIAELALGFYALVRALTVK